MSEFFGFAQELLIKKRAQEGEPYADAELYDLLNQRRGDSAFYVEFAKQQGGRVLDLACGTGRLVPELVDAGLEIVALDLSPDMIARAKARLGMDTSQVELVVGDMRTFSFDRLFNTIIIPYCSLIYMHSDADRLAVFQNCYQHLLSGGYLVFDFLAGEVELTEGWPSLALQGIHPFTDEVLLSVVQIKGLATDLRLLNQINYVFPQEPNPPKITVFSSKEAVVTPARMVALLEQVGFSVEGVFSNTALQPYDGGEDCLIISRK
ncbi:MAG: class I SAM-dependent methyltransferase [Firmicutes bacterium]|nr:class I SAM-dependent methyltransferase [Bacillota bacterium]